LYIVTEKNSQEKNARPIAQFGDAASPHAPADRRKFFRDRNANLVIEFEGRSHPHEYWRKSHAQFVVIDHREETTSRGSVISPAETICTRKIFLCIGDENSPRDGRATVRVDSKCESL
jgi:hypothetical protein